ncbi:sugar-transfer associated ATP-grasp domain-containing protein [Aromatoleum sp.]|uniref:sugar-transfer associated ATP-grasp domain-containing protein n=1 Tax=Aromatoleum sp. TaxID=2307007 RepID=UPI002FC83A89
MSQLVRKLGPEALRFFDTVLRYRANPLAAARRYWTLYRHHRFSPDEIHFLRLLDPALSESDLKRAVSKEELLAVQGRLNPAHLHARTEDKLCFHAFCRQAGLPVPEVLALFDREAAGSPPFPVLADTQDVARFLDGLGADAVILKPVAGVHGEGVMRLERAGREWRDSNGQVRRAEELVGMMSGSGYASWLFQELVVGHPELCALSATSGLQTVRVVTVIDERNDVRILAARLRLISGNHAHDNFDYGKTGNVIALLDPENGVIRSAVGGASGRHEMRSVTQHPATGRELIGYRLPKWLQVRQLAVDAANAFHPLRTIGWDVAITPDALRLIEGNVTWDTLSGESRMGEIYRYLQTLAEGQAPARMAAA